MHNSKKRLLGLSNTKSKKPSLVWYAEEGQKPALITLEEHEKLVPTPRLPSKRELQKVK